MTDNRERDALIVRGPMRQWTEATTWGEWDVLEEVGKGGQGVVRKARHQTSGAEGCIKRLNDQKDVERRARFAREAVAYDTCRHEAIPRLLQSNALQHMSLGHKLFIVTEFVPGGTLGEWMSIRGPMSLLDAAALFISLLEILAYLHDQGWVHRDIKPDNIILRNSAPGSPVLVDFGLGFKEDVTASFETELGQELGNRFLRLPELGIGSEAKQDLRSDIAFAGGVLFYALTRVIPATLSDDQGRMPHQRPSAIALLSSVAGRSGIALLGFLDLAFNPNPRGRFGNAREMLKAFKGVVAAIRDPGHEAASDDLEFIVAHVNRQASQAETETAAKVDTAMKAIQAVHSEIGERIKPAYVNYFTGHSRVPKGVRYSMGFAHFEKQEERFVPEFLIQAVGDEIVVRANGDVVYRTALESPNFDVRFHEVVRRIFSKGVRGLIEDPLAQVAARGYFKSNPHTSLARAKAAAKEQGRPLFLVIFDASSPSFSKLHYVLSAFLRNQATKDLIEEHFVTALIPSSQADAASLVPADDLLEEALWVAIAPDGTMLARETVYANADEGLGRMRQLVERLASTKGSAGV